MERLKAVWESFVAYLREVRGEVRKVIWPDRKQTTALTLVVIVTTLIIAGLTTLFDFLMSTGVAFLLKTPGT